jgi:putative tryptophan/tyrosine transport system substrate-binding protein
VKAGLIQSLSRPGGNVTGVNYMQSELGAKRLGLLHEMVPLASRVALLVNPSNSVAAESQIKDVETAAVVIGRHVEVVKAATAREIETAFARMVQNRLEALVIGAAPAVWLASPQSDGISACRFVARDWDTSLPAAEAAARVRQPAAWPSLAQGASAARGHGM